VPSVSLQFLESIENVRRNIHANDLTQAKRNLELCSANSTVETRWKIHFAAIVLMRQGDFETAIGKLTTTLQHHGSHLSVILDLAACYYMCGQLYNWKQTVEWAQFEWKRNEPLLQKSQKLKIGLLLAKFIEEAGDISGALELYNSLFEVQHQGDLSDQERIKIQSQFVRLAGQFTLDHEESQNHYRSLIQHRALDSSLDHDFEVQHALVLFEWEFVGEQVAWARIERIMHSSLANSHEMKWFMSDLLFEAIRRKSMFASKIRTLMNSNANWWESDSTSQVFAVNTILSAIIEDSQNAFDRYLHYQSQLSNANSLRLLILIHNLTGRADVGRVKSLILSGLSPLSKRIWDSLENHQKQNDPSRSENGETECWVIEKLSDGVWKIEYQSDFMIVSANQVSILELFLKGQTILLEEAIHSLWKCEVSESMMNRLRMRIYRLNKDLEQNFGRKAILSLTKTQIRSTVRWTGGFRG